MNEELKKEAIENGLIESFIRPFIRAIKDEATLAERRRCAEIARNMHKRVSMMPLQTGDEIIATAIEKGGD